MPVAMAATIHRLARVFIHNTPEIVFFPPSYIYFSRFVSFFRVCSIIDDSWILFSVIDPLINEFIYYTLVVFFFLALFLFMLSVFLLVNPSYVIVKGADRRDGHGHERKEDDDYDSQEGERDDNGHSQDDEDDQQQQLQQQHAELAELQFTVEHDHQGVDESLSYLAQRLVG